MAAIFTWFQTNWMPIIIGLLAVDRVLVQLFPTNTVLQSIMSALTSLSGGSAPLK